MIFIFLLAPKFFFLDSITFFKKKVGGFNLFKHSSNQHHHLLHHHQYHHHHQQLHQPPSINKRSTGLHPHIHSRLWLFQTRTAASGTESESICLYRTSNQTLFFFKKIWDVLWAAFCDKIQQLKLWQNSTTQIVKKLHIAN